MTILQRLGTQIQHLFPGNEYGQERAQWFLLALQSILPPITASRTSSLLRTIGTVFGATACGARCARRWGRACSC